MNDKGLILNNFIQSTNTLKWTITSPIPFHLFIKYGREEEKYYSQLFTTSSGKGKGVLDRDSGGVIGNSGVLKSLKVMVELEE